MQLDDRAAQGLNRASAADAAITDKRNMFALPFKKRAVESVLEDRRRTMVVLGDRCDERIELADYLRQASASGSLKMPPVDIGDAGSLKNGNR